MALKNIVIGVAIMILTISVVVQGVSLFYKGPDYRSFCLEGATAPVKNSEETICPSVCVEMYEIKDSECVFNSCGSGCGPDGINSFRELSQCQIALQGKDCQEVYNSANEVYSRNIFLISFPIGIAIIAFGALVFGLESVGAGLMAGGLGVVLWGVLRFWRFADEWLKFLLSLIGLILLIWLAFRMNGRDKNRFPSKKR